VLYSLDSGPDQLGRPEDRPGIRQRDWVRASERQREEGSLKQDRKEGSPEKQWVVSSKQRQRKRDRREKRVVPSRQSTTSNFLRTYMKAKATIWPWQSYVCHFRSTAGLTSSAVWKTAPGFDTKSRCAPERARDETTQRNITQQFWRCVVWPTHTTPESWEGLPKVTWACKAAVFKIQTRHM